MVMSKKILAFMAHPDDVEFKCAGTLARLQKEAGCSIAIATATSGDCGSVEHDLHEIARIRHAEAVAAAKVLDAEYYCAGCNDLLITYNEENLRRFVEVVRKAKPDLAEPAEDTLDIRRVDWLDHTFAGDRDYTMNRIRDRRRWFRDVAPDAALFVQSSNTPLRASVLGAALAGVPIVTTHRTMPWPVEDPPSGRHVFGLLPGLHLHRRKVVFKTWLTGRLARAIVYNSRQVRADYEHLYGYPSGQGIVIPNAVEIPADTSAERDPACPFTIGYVGRLGREKRVDVLLEAVARMHADQKARLLVYGEGPEKPNLLQLTDRLGLSHRVTWGGPTQNPAWVYDRCDVVVLCSRRESSSNMILEAMAAGRPVVVSSVGGLPELVDQGRAGICVPPLDAGALAAALDYLAIHDDFRRAVGRRGCERVRRLHDPRIVANTWRNLLQTVAGMKRVHRNRTPEAAETQPLALVR